ncbi:MAG: amidinotransferase [Proteobacteria bacterium]|nr:amidinotransferase [Pseudomonadota bacterium]
MTRILMCPPTYYTVSYKINPWMSVRKKPDKELAERQWKDLFDLFSKLKVPVRQIDPQPGLPDMVFTANAGLVFEKCFITGNFRYPQRQPESNHFLPWFRNNGFEIHRLPAHYYFEGEGDALFFNDVLVAGYRFRSDIHSHAHIGELIQREVLSVELINPDFYHLDTCFCPLDRESALYYPGAFDEYGKRVLIHLIPNLLVAPEEDARNFCCNAVVIGKKIILNRCSDRFRKMLESRGFELFPLEFGEYIKAGGSSKCMVLFLENP